MDSYEEKWHELQRCRNRYIFALLVYFPIVGTIGFLGQRFVRSLVPGVVVFGIWAAMLIYLGNKLRTWPCPRCGKWFSATSWYDRGWFVRRCIHCGLPKYYTPPSAKRQNEAENIW